MNNLRKLRKQKGMTLMELSALTAISESALSRAETGVADLTGQRWKIVAEVLGVSLDELLGIDKADVTTDEIEE